MKKVILTLVLGLFFVAFSNAQSNGPTGSKTVVSDKAQEVKTVVSDKVQEVKTVISDKAQEVKTDAKTYSVTETLSPVGAGASKSSCAGKAKKSCAGKSKAECATKKAECDAKKVKTEMKKTI